MKIPFILIFFLVLSVNSYAQKSSCVDCHTDANLLKKLVQVPHMEVGEGEG